jgi:arginine deiminase
VPLAPGVIVAPEGNAITKALLERNGVEVLEVEVDELMKGGGSVHCMTGVVWRS